MLEAKALIGTCTLYMCEEEDAGVRWSMGDEMKLVPERAKDCAQVLANNKEIQEQFEQALDKVSMHLYVLIAVVPVIRLGMMLCVPGGKQKRKVFREVVQSGQAEHACKFARK
eukprot:1140824-Pelagomonas_calceolata.AAC.2